MLHCSLQCQWVDSLEMGLDLLDLMRSEAASQVSKFSDLISTKWGN